AARAATCAGRLSRFGATSFGADRKMSHDDDYLEVNMPTMKGRITIRREVASPGDPLNPHRSRSRTIEPWILETAAGTTLAKLERSVPGCARGCRFGRRSQGCGQQERQVYVARYR